MSDKVLTSVKIQPELFEEFKVKKVHNHNNLEI